MKPASPELLALLASRQFYAIDLYTFSGGNLGSTVLRYCSGDMDVVANGKTYTAGKQVGPYFDRKENRAKVHWKVGMDVDTLTFDVIPGDAQLFGVKMQTSITYGTFDGAELLLERCFMPTYGDTRCGTLRYFLGRVGSIDSGRTLFTFSVNTHTELLNQQLPRNLYQASCKNNWGDKACSVVQNSYKTTGSVQPGTTTALVMALIAGSFPAGTFDQGKLVFTSGALNGLSASVRAVTFGSPASIALLGYLPKAAAAGDTFNLFYGCDKTQGSNGCAKFANLARFRAEKLIPQPQTAA